MTESNGGRSPNAVFLVGGGSQTPLLSTLLAEKLGLPRERVAVRNRSIAKTISYDGPLLQGRSASRRLAFW
jgi:sugar (pentulose or hexulose) kinase